MEYAACRSHPDAPARWRCAACALGYCDACVVRRAMLATEIQSCPQCGGLATPQEAPARPISAQLPEILAYPFKGQGKLLFLMGSLFFGIASLIRGFSVAAIALALFTAGYLCVYGFSIIEHSSAGRDEPPDWPDVTNFVDAVLGPLFKILLISIFCFAPALACLIWHAPGALLALCVALGALLWPMAVLAVTMYHSLAALNPLFLLRSIRSVLGSYLLVCALLVPVGLVQDLGPLLARVPFAGVVLQSAVSLYCLMVQMRLIGLVYWANRDRLGWFED